MIVLDKVNDDGLAGSFYLSYERMLKSKKSWYQI